MISLMNEFSGERMSWLYLVLFRVPPIVTSTDLTNGSFQATEVVEFIDSVGGIKSSLSAVSLH